MPIRINHISQKSKLKAFMHEFHSIFGLKLMDYFDEDLLHLGVLLFDILKFDDWLHEKFGDYEDEHKSMKNVVFEHFGENAANLIDALIDELFIEKCLEKKIQ